MFKKGRKREARGLAIVYFIIGLIILLIILAVIYFALVELDYSDQIKDPDATIRSYVEMTPEPEAVETDDLFDDDGFDMDVDLTTATDTPEPTATPTPPPSPTPTPEPTPSPTPIPMAMLAQPRTSNFSLPAAATNCQAALTKCYVSAADNNRYIYLAGYGFINDAAFDGAQVQSFLVVTQSKNNQMYAYQLTMKPGASGVSHDTALCKNASSCDYEVCFDVGSQFADDIYTLGLVIGYKAPNRRKATYAYYAFPSDMNFTVLGGQIQSPVMVGDATAAAPAADTGVDDAADVFGEAPFDGADAGAANTGADAGIANAAPAANDVAALADQIMAEQMITG